MSEENLDVVRRWWASFNEEGMPWAAVWKIEGGKILHAQGYTSRRQALEAAGLSE